jgi:hypothetical protein
MSDPTFDINFARSGKNTQEGNYYLNANDNDLHLDLYLFNILFP